MNRALRTAVAGVDERAKGSVMEVMRKARQLIESLLGASPTRQEAHLCLPVLGLLSQREQAMLVRFMTDAKRFRLHALCEGQNVFKEFVPHLDRLALSLRAQLAEQAASYEDDDLAAAAIGGLAGGLAHLDGPSIDRLVDAAASLCDEKQRAFALRDLSAEWPHMQEKQQQRLWRAAMGLQQHQDIAIHGLAAQLKHLGPAERKLVYARSIKIPEPWSRAAALAGLAASIEVLEPAQRETLFAQGLGLPNEMGERTRVVCALAAVGQHLNPGECEWLVRAIPELGDAKDTARALAALGPHFAHLASTQQDRLLTVAAGLGDYERSLAVAGFAAGLPRMEPARRRQVGTLALGVVHVGCKAAVIGALGPHLEHLDEDQRDALVEQALGLLRGPFIPYTLSSRDVRVLTAGLGAGLAVLREDQHDALVAAVTALDSPSFPVAERFERQPAFAEAIAGLALGRQHLSEAGFAALVEATSKLEDELRVARFRLSGASRTAARATALFGLVNAWHVPGDLGLAQSMYRSRR